MCELQCMGCRREQVGLGMDGWMDGWMNGWVDGWMDNTYRKTVLAELSSLTHHLVLSSIFFASSYLLHRPSSSSHIFFLVYILFIFHLVHSSSSGELEITRYGAATRSLELDSKKALPLVKSDYAHEFYEHFVSLDTFF